LFPGANPARPQSTDSARQLKPACGYPAALVEFNRRSDDFDPECGDPDVDLIEPKFQLFFVVHEEFDARLLIFRIDVDTH
jgi:hypothetical protein